MKRILIADASKSSLVLTSEVFKDNFPGIQVAFTRNATSTLDVLANDTAFDAVVIDFDLPDRDGADLAARIKKNLQIPILMTAFDRPEVLEACETDLAGYDDCRNIIKKPIKAEVVVNIAQRYCDGKFRTQRRIPCSIPALFEIAVAEKKEIPLEKKAAVVKKTLKSPKTSKAAKTIATKTITTVTKTWIPGFVSDSSLGGIKLTINKEAVDKLSIGKAAYSTLSSMTTGEVLAIHLPKLETLDGNKPLSHQELIKSPSASTLKSKTTKEKLGTTKTTKLEPQPSLFLLKGKIAWTAQQNSKTHLVFGIKAENASLSKRLFDALIEQQQNKK